MADTPGGACRAGRCQDAGGTRCRVGSGGARLWPTTTGATAPHARRMVRDMTVFDNEVATIVVLRRTGRICANAAGVPSSGDRARAQGAGDRERPGQDICRREI